MQMELQDRAEVEESSNVYRLFRHHCRLDSFSRAVRNHIKLQPDILQDVGKYIRYTLLMRG